jgi:tRNA pseudouridine38-40 synthase
MVRIMVGTLIDTGRGKLTGEDVMEIIENKDRRTASRTAPPQGLFLWSVNY